jgi:hypothetical protein
VSSNAISVCKLIQPLNDIRANPPQVKGNPELTKRVQKYHNINAEANEVCDIRMSQMKHDFKGATHTLPIALAEPQHFNPLAVLSIHKDVIADTLRFNQKVTELLASQKKRKGAVYL